MYHFRYLMVDPWKHFDENDYIDASNVNQIEQDKSFQVTIKLTKPFAHRLGFLRMTSFDAAQVIFNETLDFCYIDAQHGLMCFISTIYTSKILI